MYYWRTMNSDQRSQLQLARRMRSYPLHSPPHFSVSGCLCYHLTAANFEHRPIIGATPERLALFSDSLCSLCNVNGNRLHAWCVLPNHWHTMVETPDLKALLHEIGLLHGRSSFLWNKEDNERGRKCWHCCSDRKIRTEGHFCVTRNYILYNPVKHGYVNKWEEWPFSNIQDYLKTVSQEKALENWMAYPILNMGQGWDEN